MNRIGNYRLIATVGRGGMAEVFLALASGLQGFQKLLVLKALRLELAADPEFFDMFLAEARIAALLAHPNIVQTYEVGRDEERPFIAMEYLEGQPLSAILGRVGRDAFPIDLYVHVLAEMLSGLDYAHGASDLNGAALGIVHRDVSPHNVFVTYAGQVKLLDFGIAKLASSSARTQQGVLKGKIGYMAPEQATGVPVDPRADVFAAGVMLWEALARKRLVPPSEDDTIALRRRMAGEDPAAESTRDGEAPLVDVCRRAMAREPSARFESAAAMREALEAWLARPRHVLERDLAKVVEGAFERERSQIRKLVEAQVADTSTHEDAELVALPAPNSDRAIHASLHDGAPPAAVASRSSAPPTIPVPAVTRARGARIRVAAAALALAAFGAAALLVSRDRGAAPSPAPSAGFASPAAAPSPPAEVPARVRVSVVPAGAKLALDGAEVASPFDARLPRDGRVHRLRASAPGYVTDERQLTFDADLVIEIALRPEPAPATSSAPSASGAAPVATLRPRTPPKRPAKSKDAPLGIDEKDPYAQ